jgi:hypothetical protein
MRPQSHTECNGTTQAQKNGRAPIQQHVVVVVLGPLGILRPRRRPQPSPRPPTDDVGGVGGLDRRAIVSAVRTRRSRTILPRARPKPQPSRTKPPGLWPKLPSRPPAAPALATRDSPSQLAINRRGRNPSFVTNWATEPTADKTATAARTRRASTAPSPGRGQRTRARRWRGRSSRRGAWRCRTVGCTRRGRRIGTWPFRFPGARDAPGNT